VGMQVRTCLKSVTKMPITARVYEFEHADEKKLEKT